MNLALDHQGRINLCALIGMMECRNVSDVRAAWQLMDKIGLSESEQNAIDYRLQRLNGSEVPVWNTDKSLPPVEYSFDASETSQIQRALNGARVLPGPMRRWLEPLITQLPAPPAPDH